MHSKKHKIFVIANNHTHDTRVNMECYITCFLLTSNASGSRRLAWRWRDACLEISATQRRAVVDLQAAASRKKQTRRRSTNGAPVFRPETEY
jgi:hypothetical protein